MRISKVALVMVLLCGLAVFVQANAVSFIARKDFTNMPLVVPFEGEEGLVEVAINGIKALGYILSAPDGKTYLITTIPTVRAGSRVEIEVLGKTRKGDENLPDVKGNVAAVRIETKKLILTIVKKDKKIWVSQFIVKDFDPEINLVVGGGLLNPQFHKGDSWYGFWDAVKKVAEVVDVNPLGVVLKLGGRWDSANFKPVYTGKLFVFNEIPAMVAFVDIKLAVETRFSGSEFVSIEFWGDKGASFLTTLIVPSDEGLIVKRVADKPGFIPWNSTWYDFAKSEEKDSEVGLGVVFLGGDKFQAIRSQDGNEAATAWQGNVKERKAVLLLYAHTNSNYNLIKDLYENLSAAMRGAE